MFERFTTAAREVVINAQQAARQLGHPFIGTEHVLLGLIHEPRSATARLLSPHGLDPATVGADIHRLLGDRFEPDLSFTEADAGIDATFVRHDIARRVGPHPPESAGPPIDRDREDAEALKAIGIDLDEVRRAIEANFGAGALRLHREGAPRKRGLFGRFAGSGGHILFTNRAKKVLELALREALRLQQNFIAPEHIMLGLLREGDGLAAQILREKSVDFARLRADMTAALRARAA